MWKSTVTGLPSKITIEILIQPSKLLGDLIAVLVGDGIVLRRNTADDHSEHVAVRIIEGTALETIGRIEAAGHRAQILADAGLNALVHFDRTKASGVEISFKLINRIAVCGKADGALILVPLIDLGIVWGCADLHCGRPDLSGKCAYDDAARSDIRIATGAEYLEGNFTVAEKNVLVPALVLLADQMLIIRFLLR